MLLQKYTDRRHIPVRAPCVVNGLCDGQVIFRSSALDAAGLILANVFAALTVFRDTSPGNDVLFTGQVIIRGRGGDCASGQSTLGGGIYAQGSDVVYTGSGTYAFPVMIARSHLGEAVEFVILCEQLTTPNRVIEFIADGQIVAGIGRLRPGDWSC